MKIAQLLPARSCKQMQETANSFTWTAHLSSGQASLAGRQAVGEGRERGGNTCDAAAAHARRHGRAGRRQFRGGPVHLAQVGQAGLAPLQLARQPLRVRHACVATAPFSTCLTCHRSHHCKPSRGVCTAPGGGGGGLLGVNSWSLGVARHPMWTSSFDSFRD